MINKQILFIIVLFLSYFSFAQKGTYAVTIQPIVGYEMNVLKAPSRYENSDGSVFTSNELWQNMPYIGLSTRYIASDESKKNNVKLYGFYQKSITSKENEANSSDAVFKLSYRVKNGKRINNKIEFAFRRFNRTGNDADGLIGIPLAYNRFKLSNVFGLKINKYWKVELAPMAGIKGYNTEKYDRFSYFDFGIKSTLFYKYTLKSKPGYFLDIGFHQRNYTINEIVEIEEFEVFEEENENYFEGEEDEEIEPEIRQTSRAWNNYAAGIGTKIPIAKNMKLTGRFGYTNRTDLFQNKFGYNQFEVTIGSEFKQKKWIVQCGVTVSNKFYTDIKTSTKTQNLHYYYLKYNLLVKRSIGKQFNLILRTSGVNRISNSDYHQNKTMRSYFLGDVNIGLSWNIKKSFK